MRLANLNGRATLVTDEGLIDVEKASWGRFTSNTDALFAQRIPPDQWRSPSFLSGRRSQRDVRIPSPMTDRESELVVVIGKRACNVDDALGYVTGYCVRQDLSDRALQMLGSPAQFSLGRSYENFAPIGPWLTTTDEIPDPNALKITCSVNDVLSQNSNTSDMVFSVCELVSCVSSVCEIRPGDIMFTGSRQGVGRDQNPSVFLKPGDVIETAIEGLESLRNVGRTR